MSRVVAGDQCEEVRDLLSLEVQHSGLQVRGHELRVSVALPPPKKVMLSNMFRAESFLKKKGVNTEYYTSCPKGCKILNKLTDEDLGETPRVSNMWAWHDDNCASGGFGIVDWLLENGCHFRVRREKCQLGVVSWNVQRVSGGLSALISHLSELEDWDAVMSRETTFRGESIDLEALEASLRGHKLVLNSSCPWDTAIVIHSR